MSTPNNEDLERWLKEAREHKRNVVHSDVILNLERVNEEEIEQLSQNHTMNEGLREFEMRHLENRNSLLERERDKTLNK
jgi:hypothetical protein